ncbi:MAG: DUF4153 domain-containing protein [Treponemataceae bacterium]|nr:DUF4153 domain-containing protein [Treponemataceae bacterium]
MKLWCSVKPAATRFPALFVLGIVAAVALSLDFPYGLDELTGRIAWAGVWGMLLSVLAQLILERQHGRRVQLVAQTVVFALSVFALPPLFSLIDKAYCFTFLLLPGVPIALAAGIVFLLARAQGIELTIPNCVISALIAGIASLCAMAGLLVVFFAFTELIVELPSAGREVVLYLLIFLPLIAVQAGIFIAFAAREREQISLPAAYKVIILRILLPIGIALLAVLYAYLLKCLFTLTMPVGKINPFVSLATGFFLFFYFAALPYESPFLAFFRKYGAIFLLPLAAAQIVAFAIRIEAYGYTPARVASLMYIIFSVASCALTLVRGGKYVRGSFLIFAALCILGSATPLNVIDVAMRSQVARIVRVYRAHDLLANGVPVAEGAAEALTAEEKRTVYESWDALWLKYDSPSMPKWAQVYVEDFESTFGFDFEEAKYGEKTKVQFSLNVPDAITIDVSAFSYMKRIDSYECDTSEKGIFATIHGQDIDLTDALTPYIPQENTRRYGEPLIVPAGGGKTLILTYIRLTSYLKPTNDDDKLVCWIEGYLCW